MKEKKEKTARVTRDYDMEVLTLQEVRWERRGKNRYGGGYGGVLRFTGFMISKKFIETIIEFK